MVAIEPASLGTLQLVAQESPNAYFRIEEQDGKIRVTQTPNPAAQLHLMSQIFCSGSHEDFYVNFFGGLGQPLPAERSKKCLNEVLLRLKNPNNHSSIMFNLAANDDVPPIWASLAKRGTRKHYLLALYCYPGFLGLGQRTQITAMQWPGGRFKAEDVADLDIWLRYKLCGMPAIQKDIGPGQHVLKDCNPEDIANGKGKYKIKQSDGGISESNLTFEALVSYAFRRGSQKSLESQAKKWFAVVDAKGMNQHILAEMLSRISTIPR